MKSVKVQADIHCYADAARILGDDGSCHLTYNTWVVRIQDSGIAIKLHDTCILTYFPDDTFVFRTGGWNTVTTRQRLNQFGPLGSSFCNVKGVLHHNGKTGQEGVRLPVYDFPEATTPDDRPNEMIPEDYYS